VSGLDEALDVARRRDLRRAARTLLRWPLLSAGGAHADEFLLVRRYAGELREWFDLNTGWRLHVDAEVARLAKRTIDRGDASRPATDRRGGGLFSRRRYVLACLALAVLERSDVQITLGGLAEGVLAAAADPRLAAAGVSFRLEGRAERSDLVAVVRLLLELGVISRVAGHEEAFVRDAGDVLYDVERRVLATLLVPVRGPSMISAAPFVERVDALTDEPVVVVEEARTRRIRHRLTRRLLDDPVLYYADLSEEELSYLTGQRAAITRRITELTGLTAEVRAEGIAMVDEDDELSDVRMPEVGTDGHVALLLAEHLATHATLGIDARVNAPVAEAELHRVVRELAPRYRSFWRKGATEPGAEVALVEQALVRLAALSLIRREADLVWPLPAVSRFAMAEPTLQLGLGVD
jgi:uncharacterized protein (TIGR02678 family)